MADHPLSQGRVPEWAQTWGEDIHGVWAGFVLGEVEHRLRWIPGGRLLTHWEGEPKEVELDGYWLGETPVTQALWTEVMGHNPSRFQSERLPWRCLERPVEQVSWEDVQEFLRAVDERQPELELRLPSELEWEVAARATTETDTYAGDLDDAEFASSVLDGIAWYGGNSGQGFELEGVNLSQLFRREGLAARAGTHPVGLKAPNPWGLCDVLGNVWEWCQDQYERGTERVFRGGSWGGPAWRCRAAFRDGRAPGRRGDLGFRVSRGQVSVPRDAGPSRERSEPRPAEPGRRPIKGRGAP